MTVICRKLPLFVRHAPPGPCLTVAGSLRWRSDRPEIAAFCTGEWEVKVTLDALLFGRYEEYDEQYGTATVRPVENSAGPLRWVEINATVLDATFIVCGHRLADIVSEMHRAANLPTCADWEHDWPLRGLRRDGAA